SRLSYPSICGFAFWSVAPCCRVWTGLGPFLSRDGGENLAGLPAVAAVDRHCWVNVRARRGLERRRLSPKSQFRRHAGVWIPVPDHLASDSGGDHSMHGPLLEAPWRG